MSTPTLLRLPDKTTFSEAMHILVETPGSPFAIQEEEISGTVQTVFSKAPKALPDLFDQCQAFGHADFVSFDDECYSFDDIHQSAVRLSNALVNQHGVRKGDRVAIAMQNCPEWIISYLGIIGAGAIAAPMNSWWTRDELAWGIGNCGSRLVIVDRKLRDRISPLCAELGLNLIVARDNRSGDHCVPWEDVLRYGKDSCSWPDIKLSPDDDAMILYTSGSEGDPKGVVSTQRAVITTMFTWMAMGQAAKMIGRIPMERPTQAVALATVPFFHVTGCLSLLLLSLITGRKVVLMHRWDVTEAMRLIERERVTFVMGVPTMTYEMMTSPDRHQFDLSSLENLGAGGAARPKAHVAQLAKTFPHTTLGQGYGLTETTALGSAIGGDELLAHPASSGKPFWPAVAVNIVNPVTGDELAQGQRGEIWIKSAGNMRCYWNNPKATAQALQDGWLRTGDVGYLDEEGYLYIVDRLKDIIIRGGENISTLEVEEALLAHDRIHDAVVFSLPDERLGELVGCAVYGKDVNEEQIKDFLAPILAAYKIPAKIWVQSKPLPRIAAGKIDRVASKSQYRAVWASHSNRPTH